jgi:hypothetical protein
MHATSFGRWLFLGCCLTGLAVTPLVGGCAVLARATPALSVDATATQRRHLAEGRSDEAWSWGIGVRLGAGLGAPPPQVAPPDRTWREPVPPALGSRCRVPEVCAWEARARSVAIERARGALEIERQR